MEGEHPSRTRHDRHRARGGSLREQLEGPDRSLAPTVRDEGPELGGVGLFAILGPTGAGKFTVLDAL
jgi:hypothetical protein